MLGVVVATFFETALAGVLDTFGSGDSSLSSFLLFFDLDYEVSFRVRTTPLAEILTVLTTVLISSATTSSLSSSSSSIADNGAF